MKLITNLIKFSHLLTIILLIVSQKVYSVEEINHFEFRNYKWIQLLSKKEEPSCYHFYRQNSELFEKMSSIQKSVLSSNFDYLVNDYESQLDQLLVHYSNYHSLIEVMYKNYYEIQFNIEKSELKNLIDKSEVMLAQNSKMIESFENNQFLRIPWVIAKSEDSYNFNLKVSIMDICQMKSVKFKLLSDCSKVDNSMFDCVKHNTCPAFRVPDLNSCKVSNVISIPLEKLSHFVGSRNESIGRK